jgi:hypothetical protein
LLPWLAVVNVVIANGLSPSLNFKSRRSELFNPNPEFPFVLDLTLGKTSRCLGVGSGRVAGLSLPEFRNFFG